MNKQIPKYVKYSAEELDNYIQTDGSCVKKVNTTLKFSMLPVDLHETKKARLLNFVSTKKIGLYDQHLQSIILDIRNIKLLENTCAIRFDDPRIYLKIKCDCYIFQPLVGAIVSGIVCHVSSSQIAVIIYRVFNVSIRVVNKSSKPIEVDSEIYFKVKKFNLENIVPYIEGELVKQTSVEEGKILVPAMVKGEIDDSTTDDYRDLEKVLNEIKEEPSVD